MVTKPDFMKALGELPEDATIDDAMERLLFMIAVEHGLAQADAGKLIPHEEIVERVKQWLDRRMFKKLFAGIQGDSLSALDVGGGTGWLLSQAREVEPRLKHTAVVDIDAQAREGAEKLGHAFHLGRVEDFKTDRKYDLILLLNLIEHVEDPVGVLSKMRELLAPGGRILATLLREMDRREARYGLETMCIGGGQGLAAVFERVA